MNRRLGRLVQKGTDLREKVRHQQALEVLDKALRLALNHRDFKSVADALASRCLTWKHLFQLTAENVYLVLARSDAEAGLALVKAKKLKNLHSAFFRVAEVAVISGDYKTAVADYKLALRHYRGSRTERGDYQYHYGEALYRMGQRAAGLRELNKGLRDIQTFRREVDSFLVNVWESGANMRLCELLWKSKPVEALEYLKSAEHIISRDKRLVMRRKQLAILKQKLNG